MKWIEILRLVISIIACQFVGFIGSFFTRPVIPTWYANLSKPSFTPPNWIFAPVWTTLFFLMGISAFLVWRHGLKDNEVKVALKLFVVQLILNALWSVVFFGVGSPLFALLEIVILWVAIFLTIQKFYRISVTAGILLLPYLFWVSFAALLNFCIWRLNS